MPKVRHNQLHALLAVTPPTRRTPPPPNAVTFQLPNGPKYSVMPGGTRRHSGECGAVVVAHMGRGTLIPPRPECVPGHRFYAVRILLDKQLKY